MAMLVTLEEALQHLRIAYDETSSGLDSSSAIPDYADIELKIEGASGAIIRYLGEQAGEVIEYDSDGNITDVDRLVKIATLIFVGELYHNREGEQGGEIDQQWGYAYLPRPVIALLSLIRCPVAA